MSPTTTISCKGIDLIEADQAIVEEEATMATLVLMPHVAVGEVAVVLEDEVPAGELLMIGEKMNMIGIGCTRAKYRETSCREVEAS